MTPEENVAFLEGIRAKVATAAPPCADAMGQTHKTHLVHVTLMESGKSLPPTAHSDPLIASAPGDPPGILTGRLRASVTCVPGVQGGAFASSIVGPHTIYARTLEWGDVHTGRPSMWLWVGYVGPAVTQQRGWVRQEVDIPARPYMRPSRDAVLADGSVVREANFAFTMHVWG